MCLPAPTKGESLHSGVLERWPNEAHIVEVNGVPQPMAYVKRPKGVSFEEFFLVMVQDEADMEENEGSAIGRQLFAMIDAGGSGDYGDIDCGDGITDAVPGTRRANTVAVCTANGMTVPPERYTWITHARNRSGKVVTLTGCLSQEALSAFNSLWVFILPSIV